MGLDLPDFSWFDFVAKTLRMPTCLAGAGGRLGKQRNRTEAGEAVSHMPHPHGLVLSSPGCRPGPGRTGPSQCPPAEMHFKSVVRQAPQYFSPVSLELHKRIRQY